MGKDMLMSVTCFFLYVLWELEKYLTVVDVMPAHEMAVFRQVHYRPYIYMQQYQKYVWHDQLMIRNIL